MKTLKQKFEENANFNPDTTDKPQNIDVWCTFPWERK